MFTSCSSREFVLIFRSLPNNEFFVYFCGSKAEMAHRERVRNVRENAPNEMGERENENVLKHFIMTLYICVIKVSKNLHNHIHTSHRFRARCNRRCTIRLHRDFLQVRAN